MIGSAALASFLAPLPGIWNRIYVSAKLEFGASLSGRPLSGTPRVVIIGGGFGGLEVARQLRSAPVKVTLIDRKNHHTFQPLLYQVATAGLSPGEIAAPIRWILRSQDNVEVLLGEVTGFDLGKKVVQLADGEIPYDYLVVASGARHSYFGHDDWEAIAPGLKSIEDATEIRRRIFLAFELAEREAAQGMPARDLNFVVVGGGPTGVELAGTLAEIARHVMANEFHTIDPKRTRVLLLEGGPRVLPSYPESLSRSAEAQLTKLGVEVRTSTTVTGMEPGRVMFRDSWVSAAVILWAAGVAASPLGKALGAPTDRAGRVHVQADLSIPEHAEVFVIGDLAALNDATGGLLPGVAPVAMQQGAMAGKNISRLLQGQRTESFIYHDKGSMATIGRAAAVVYKGKLQLSGYLAWLAWLFVHILFLIGFRNRLMVMIQWAWSYLTYQRGARLITGDSGLTGWSHAPPEQSDSAKSSAGEGRPQLLSRK